MPEEEEESYFDELDMNCYVCMKAEEGDILIICDKC